MAAAAAVRLEQSDRKTAFERLRAQLAAKPPGLPVESLLPTAIPELDRLLGGGFPAGIVATLEGETGCWSLAAGLAAQFTRRGLVAIVDDGALYPPALAEAGVSLERVLVVPVLQTSLPRAESRGSGRKALATARAADILLRSRICRLVLMPAVALRDAVWERLAKLAHRSGALLIVVTACAGSALSAVAAVRLHCTLERALVHGHRGLWGIVCGFELCVGLRKHKHMAAGGSTHVQTLRASS